MEELRFTRLHKEDRPVLAICYDFDRTLSPDDMQAQGFIQSVGYDVAEFWKESNELAEKNDMDMNLAYMLTMCKKTKGKFYLTRDALRQYGGKIELYNGVQTWFERINEYGRSKGVTVEHYIISSGLREMIEGTAIAKEFKKIYASAFLYDDCGVPEWPAQTVNYTNKTQFIFRIEKGCLDINDHEGVNEYIRTENLRIPMRNLVYIGDSDTDIPCMKLVNSYGGHSVGVYNPATRDKSKVYNMVKNNRIRYFAAADYSEGSELDALIKAIVDKTAVYEVLEDKHVKNLVETRDQDKKL